MRIGMGWFIENKQQPVADAVREAADYFLAKHDSQATECWANPADLAGVPAYVGPIKMVGSSSIIRRNLWIGAGETVNIHV